MPCELRPIVHLLLLFGPILVTMSLRVHKLCLDGPISIA